MSSPRPADRAAAVRRLTDLDGFAGWVAIALIVTYVVGFTYRQVAHIGDGVGFLPAWSIVAALSVAGAQLLKARRNPQRAWLRPIEVAPLLALPAVVLTDIAMLYQPLRDLGIYLKAGHRFLAGQPVYITAPLQVRPEDLSNYPFLYPPMTLPLFGALALLPDAVARGLWVTMSVGLGLAAFRLFGVRWRWAVAALLWPPLFQGLFVGNVAVPALALFAVAPMVGSGLVVGAIAKSYTGLAALWLVRERRWLDLALGIGAVVVVAALAVPLTGLSAWQDWIEALRLYQISQQNVPLLYGLGLAKWLPIWIVLIVAVATLAVALTKPGKQGLARLGTATVVASPSLWGHGILMAVPSILSLRPMVLWLAIALASIPDGPQWWWLIALIGASWIVPALRRDEEGEAGGSSLDPLISGATGPWPDRPRRSRRPAEPDLRPEQPRATEP